MYSTGSTKKLAVWEVDCFAAEFCDHFADDVVSGTGIYHSYSFFGQTIDFLLTRAANGTIQGDVGQKCDAVLRRLRQFLDKSDSLFRKLQIWLQWKLNFHLSKIVDEICKLIGSMAPGDVSVFPLPTPLVMASAVVQLNPADPSQCIVTLINPSPDTPYHVKTVDKANPSKLKQSVAMTLSAVPRSKLQSEAFWACVFISSTKLEKDDVLYTHLCEWLTDRPFEPSVAQFLSDPSCVFASPCKSGASSHWKSLVHALKFLLRGSGGLSAEQVKYVRFFIKQSLLESCFEDLSAAESIKVSTRKLIQSAAASAAMSLARNSQLFQYDQLLAFKSRIEELNSTLMAKKCDDVGETAAPPKIDLQTGWDLAQQPDSYPLWETLRRLEDTDQFAGAKTENMKSSPLNFFRIPAKLSTLDEAIDALQDVTVMCVRLNEQITANIVKNGHHLMLAMLHSFLLKVLPTPLPPPTVSGTPASKSGAATAAHSASAPCIWSHFPIRYAQQVFVIQRLHDLCELYAWCCRSNAVPAAAEEFDGVRMTIFCKIASIADAVMRRVAADRPSMVSLFWGGHCDKPAFGFTLGQFARQSASVVFVNPEALATRAEVLDYFEGVHATIPSTNVVWKWEDSVRGCAATERLYKLLLQSECITNIADSHVLHFFASNGDQGRHSVLHRYYPEMKHLRNIVIMMKHFMSNQLIHQTEWLKQYPSAFSMNWNESSELNIYGFGGYNVLLRGEQRYKSKAVAATYTQPFDVASEDDLLHIKTLPAFDDEVGQRDAELLYSYLTVPYMRIPLVLRFFSSEDRVSCLRSTKVQELLMAVLFEPAKFLPASLSQTCPQEVPTENGELIATAYGLLLNELQTSPSGVVEPIIRLVELAREMDAGTVFNTTATDVILYLITIVARVNTFIVWSLRNHATKNAKLRDCATIPECEATLREASASLKKLIHCELLPMLEKWTNEAMRNVTDAKSGSDVDVCTSLAARLHLKVILLLRNHSLEDHTVDTVSRFVSSFAFLTTRYSFGSDAVGNEIDIYDAFEGQRRTLAEWMSTVANVKDVAFVCDSAVRVATSSGTRTSPGKANGGTFEWGLLAGPESVGRFARLDDELLKRNGRGDGRDQLVQALCKYFNADPKCALKDGIQTVREGLQDVEISLQTMTLTFKSAHLQAIPADIAQNQDVFDVFGHLFGNNKNLLCTMQCATVEDATNRLWIRLVGQDHDVQFWRTQDPRFAIPDDTARYFPDDLAPTEEWVYNLFEPVRRKYFERSFWQPPIFILLPERKLTSNSAVASLTAVCSRTGRKLKEMYVFRDYECVHVYDVYSYGRRFFRSLIYSSNAHYSLVALQPSTGAKMQPWPAWERHGAGDPTPDDTIATDQSAVILRHPTHPLNLSRSIETFIPTRNLAGLVPTALLETHEFWQDGDDNVRGYPVTKKADLAEGERELPSASDKTTAPTHLLWIHWRETQFDALDTKNTCAKIYRFAVAQSAPRASEEAVLASQKLQVVDAVDEEIGMTRLTSEKTEDDMGSTADLEAGAFRQSSVVYTAKQDAATIEDHNLLLLNLMYARSGTPLFTLACVFARIELLSHVLVWTTQVDYSFESGSAPPTIDLIHLPRLKLSFAARLGPNGKSYVIQSLDHAHLFISNVRQPLVVDLLQGVPHSIILSDANDAFSILVPSVSVYRPTIGSAPFSTELVLNRAESDWTQNLETKYYLYPVHVSLSFIFTPTLASALYLLLLRFLHRNYEDVFRLAGSIGTDMAFTAEELQIFKKITKIYDSHPNAHACKSKIALLVADSPVDIGYYMPHEVSAMIAKMSHVSVSCRMPQSEERRLLYICKMLEGKMAILREAVEKSKEAYQAVFETELRETERIFATKEHRKIIRPFLAAISNTMREKLNVRCSKEDVLRLLSIFSRFCKEPMMPYLQCLLANRFTIVEGEMRAQEQGVASIRLQLMLPAIGKDLQWNFWSDFNPLSAKPSFPMPKNELNHEMSMSSRWDYWYCNLQTRTANSCRCKSCDQHCGNSDQQGCPCAACEKWNKAELSRVRLLPPTFDTSRLMRTISFYDIFSWMSEMFARYNNSKPNEQFPYLNKNIPMTLREASNSFLRYYELLTGACKAKVAYQDSAKDLAALLFPFSLEARNITSGAGHLVHFLIATPQCHQKLSKYNRSGKSKPEQKLTAVYNSIFEQAAINKTAPNDAIIFKKTSVAHLSLNFQTNITVDLVPRPHERTALTPLQATTILPLPDNTACSRRVLGIPDLSKFVLLGNEMERLRVTEELRSALTGHLLRGVVPEDLVVYADRAAQGLPHISTQLAFDLTKHEYSRKTVAREMLSRIEDDVKQFADKSNKVSAPKLQFFASEKAVRSIMALDKRSEVLAICGRLQSLSAAIQAVRDADLEFVAHALPVITRTANHIEHEASFASTLLSLRRFANKEAIFTVEYLLASLCSTSATNEWRQLNPFIHSDTSDHLLNLIAIAVLRANRVGHINRICEGIKELEALLKKVLGVMDGSGEFVGSLIDAIVASIQQKADNVASLLVTRRVYFDLDSTKKEVTYDPRFLLFEFTWNLVLRQRQRELVMETYNSVAQDRKSIVKQMIMGAGKTTVVGPLLGLMLADGSNLIIQVVPPALLDFTRAVLRSTFSTVLQKQIFTFICDRASDVDSEILSKFQHAKQARGIVVTTPSSVKSMFLKYVEGLDRISDSSRPRTVELEKEAQDILKVLTMWRSSVLIMDEVDMLLHPLKSELNFPIGQKHEIDFTPTRWKMPIHLIDALFYYHTKRISVNMKDSPDAHAILSKFREAIKSGIACNALQEMPHLTLLNPEFYDNVMKPVLSEWLLLFLKAQHLFGLSDEETLTYITKRPSTNSNKTLVQKVEALEPNHVKMLNLAYEWLTCFIPHILQKIDRVSFGIMNQDDIRRAEEEHPNMPASRFVTAIPFIGKDLPSQSSEFAHPDVVIGLTVLAYRYEGIRRQDFDSIMWEVHAAVEKEVGRFNQRRTNIMFTKWVHAAGGKILANYSYQEAAAQQAAEITGTASSDALLAVSSEGDHMGIQPSESILFDAELAQQSTDQDGSSAALSSVAAVQILPLKLMKQANEDESNKLFKLFKRSAEVIHWYLCEDVFPQYMRHQHAKLSASGQELGGDILFERRVGFSGTPSDLLPVEMGRCGYEVGTDGQLIHTLTDPTVVNCTVFETGWSVRSLLDYIANATPPFHALIDTGALITGLSNLQVAQYLLKNGLHAAEGVVFLDEYDRKMILVRATGRVLKLAECGIPKVKRFAFYDQVHTTGMDIDHTPNAQAVQTLGKDMTFRDFSQGAYRMRGIGQGQTVNLLIIPEVYDLMNRSLASVRPTPDVGPSARAVRSILLDVTAWLLVNSIRSEHTQHNQLCIQSCANTWRKEAFQQLAARVEEFRVTQQPSEPALRALRVFREAISFDVPVNVPQPRMFSEAVMALVAPFLEYVSSEAGKGVIASILDQTKREDEIDNPVIDVQMVQEQEEEKESEQEQEKEQEIEIEKFVDVAYSRDEEASSSWKLASLANPVHAVQFYKLTDFHLYKRRSLEFPQSLMLSRNYFNPKWSGHRRMKNVVITMEWIPSEEDAKEAAQTSADYGTVSPDVALQVLAKSLSTMIAHRGATGSTLPLDVLRDLLQVALHTTPSAEEVDDWTSAIAQLQKDMAADADAALDGAARAFYSLLASNKLRREETGRNTVVLSLSEAETIRRIIHLRKIARKSLIERSNTSIALNVVPAGNAILDTSLGFRPAKTPFQSTQNFQCLRYFDSDLHYTDQEFGMLLRSLHSNPTKHRQAFFQQVIACRRRARQRWERAPIAMLFLLHTAFTLLHQRVIGLCMYRELVAKDLNLGDAFVCFNSSHSGTLSPGEVWGAAKFCRLDNLSSADVLDFLDVADSQHEGTLQYPDFLCVLTGSRELEESEAAAGGGGGGAEDRGKNLPTVHPFGEEELHAARLERIKKQAADEAEASKEMESENKRVMDEIEAEQIREEMELLQNAGNPVLAADSLSFIFNGEDVQESGDQCTNRATFRQPKLIAVSAGKVCRVLDDMKSSTVIGASPAAQTAGIGAQVATMLTSNSGLKASLRCVKHLVGAPVLKQYSITVEFKMPRPLGQTNSSKSLTQILEACGQVGELLAWSLPLYQLTTVTGVPYADERLEQQKEKDKAEKIAAKEMKDAESKKAKAEKKKKIMIKKERQEGDDNDETEAEARQPEGEVAEEEGEALIGESSEPQPDYEPQEVPADCDECEADASEQECEEEGEEDDAAEVPDEEQEENERYPFFAAADAGSEIVGYLKLNELVELGTHRVRTNIEGCGYEWRELLSGPKRGWVITTVNNTTEVFAQQQVRLQLKASKVELLVGPVSEVADSFNGTILPVGGVDHGSMDEAADDSDDEGHINDLELLDDVGDLLEALRKAKSLRPGDRVQRNPASWDKGNEDGGEGKVGKVLKVEEASITVQWPSGNKGTYVYGACGKYDLIKVGDADDDEGEDEGEIRELMNDDRWVVLIKNKGKEKCSQCQTAKLDLGNWFRCNQCENYNLCKPCFKAGHHTEHDFTDMKAISVTDENRLGPGSWVKIRISVDEPQKGWQGASHDCVGVVTDMDEEAGTVLVDFDGIGDWEGFVSEVEVTEEPKQAEGGAAAGARNVPALDFILANRWKPAISLVQEVAKRPTKFIVGDRVSFFREDYGSTYPGVVRAVMSNKLYTVVIDNEDFSKEVDESKMRLLPFAMGDKVRFKKSIENPIYGWSYLENLPGADARYRKEGKITYIGGGGENFLYLNVDFDSNEGWTMAAADTEVEVIGGGEKNVKWFMSVPRSDTSLEEEFSQLQSSSAIGVERAFQLGVKSFKFYMKDKNFVIDFPSMTIYEQAAAGTGAAACSKRWIAEREPPRPWEHHRQATVLDDGHWHILSLIVTDTDVLAICDGENLPVSFTGSVADKIQKIRSAKTAGLMLLPRPSAGEAANEPPPPPVNEDVADLGKINDFFYLPTQTPLFIMRNALQAEEVRRVTSTSVEESFPRRLISKFVLHWGQASSADVQAATVAAHRAVLDETSWTCRHCGFRANYRFFDQCDECQEKRVEKKEGRSQQVGKVRAVFPKSREAQQLRQKLQGKLRSQFQKELDLFDRGGAGAAEPRVRDASPDIL
jgi:hypothetical protein